MEKWLHLWIRDMTTNKESRLTNHETKSQKFIVMLPRIRKLLNPYCLVLLASTFQKLIQAIKKFKSVKILSNAAFSDQETTGKFV